MGIMIAIALAIPSCSGSVDRDAQQLATYQKERVRTIKTMLETDDSIQLNICRQQLTEQTTKYYTCKKRMETKYNNKESRASFEEAFRRALE